ncbi:MAG: PAS domain S-box protein [Chloroflexota bacterium]|nr:MAG: PAS domain S-box protein [Chloroflexota bacterium]
MSGRLPSLFNRSDWRLLAVSLAVFALYAFYALSYLLLTPYPGVEITTFVTGWRINDTVQPDLEVEDVLVQIGDLSYDQYLEDWLSVPFRGYLPGEVVPNVIKDNGQEVDLEMPQPSLDDRIKRLVTTLWFFPFWLAGTAVLLFLRPRDRRWQLLIAIMYLTAIWIVVGSIANWQISGSRYVAIVVGWAMAPVFLHLHLTVPNPLMAKRHRLIIPILYALVIVLAIAELLQLLPRSTSLLAISLAILCSFILLIYRTLSRRTPISDRHSARLMLAGLGLAFGPALLLVQVPVMIGVSIPSVLALSIAFISLPILPISYTYAIYKRQLGALEFRANRLLSLYSFILIYPTLFVVVLLLGEQWITASGTRTVFLLFVSIVFVLAIPPLVRRMQDAVNRLAYGTEHDPDDILRVFASQIPSTLNRNTMTVSLTKDILPSMLIRQSALVLDSDDGELDLMYAERVPETTLPESRAQLEMLQGSAGAYRPPVNSQVDRLDWVRLAITLVTRDQTLGVWLFGRRDPDDFYPQNDIELLQTLANQMTPVIENVRLYEALQRHADNLAEQVAERTAELQAERDRTQAILDSAGEGIFFIDQAGIILYTNAEMALQSGYSTDELRGKSLDLWKTDEQRPEAYRHMWTAIYTGTGWSGELLLERQDGSYCDVSLAVAPINAPDGELTGFVGVQSDISKLKEVDRVKSNIISSVTHELKTPLTTIKTYLMLLRRGKLEKRENYMAVLDRETDRLANIIEDLLDLAKLETGKIPTRLEPVSIVDAVDAVVTSCNARILGNSMHVVTDVAPELPLALADRGQLELVLTNLVVNALNYTPAGGDISIDSGIEENGDGSEIWIRVTDNGPGIAAIDFPHLFDRFYRGQTALDSGAPGTGLGLAICKEIVERHQGRIEAESVEGSGAAFTVWLQTAASDGPEQLVKVEAEISPTAD